MVFVEDHLVFIKRSDSMPSHKGQVGFMGGHKEHGELDPIKTALRELEEESSFQHHEVDVKGMIEPVFTSNSKLLIPVVSQFKSSMRHFLDGVKANDEWDHLILCPLDYLASAQNWQVGRISLEKPRVVGFCPLNQSNHVIHPPHKSLEFLLWGASAKMVWNFFKCHK